jgi:citrate lyase beta subunit
MTTTTNMLFSAVADGVKSRLKDANLKFNHRYPGVPEGRQPVHTVYGGAQLFTAQTARKMGETSLRTMAEYAPDSATLARGLGIDPVQFGPDLWQKVYDRVTGKLKSEAVEDFRIDFEDGYGNRPDAEEDGHAASAAREVALGMKEGTLPPFLGIRIKPFNQENINRSVRTLDIFLDTLLEATGNKMPPNFVITLPKITVAAQSRALAELLAEAEKKRGLPKNTLKFEIMVEMPQIIIDDTGRSPLREIVDAGDGRCVGAHFGTYDYTAGCQITASFQTMANPVCDFAKHVLQVSLATTPVMISDGATNVMPVGPHRAAAGTALTKQQIEENRAVVYRAWQLSYKHIRHSLETGYYQGWDLHPAQLPVRYAAMYAFFLESFDSVSERLKGFVEKAAKATLLGDVFDDAATGQGLLNFFLRGISCGAITEAEALRTGLTLDEIRGRSFLKILQNRKIV